jgi:hypothetical protein
MGKAKVSLPDVVCAWADEIKRQKAKEIRRLNSFIAPSIMLPRRGGHRAMDLQDDCAERPDL